MKCMTCGAPTKLQKNQTVAYDFGGLPDVSLRGIDIAVCTNGHREYLIPRIEQLHAVIAQGLAKKASRLTAEEVVYLRKYLGWSQRDFAERMGVTYETANRWERGSIMFSALAERLLRLMVMTQEPVDDYHNFDLFKKIGDAKPTPARMKLRPAGAAWQLAFA